MNTVVTQSPPPRKPVKERGAVANFFIFLWDAMNFTRRLVFNIIFFGLILLIIIGIALGGRVAPIEEKTTLIIEPKGQLVEQYSIDAASRAFGSLMGSEPEQTQLRDLLKTIEDAGKDKRIARVFLRVDSMTGAGYASLREVAAALKKLRASGKEIIAFGQLMDQKQYYLAAQANEIYIDPEGGVLLEGLGRYRQYYREGLQDKLGVDMHVFKVGTFKSAVEPFILDAASPEAKEADLYWMNDVWQRYVKEIADARKLDATQLNQSINTLADGIVAANGDMAKFSLDQKLVTGLKTLEEVENILAERGAKDEDAEGGYRQIAYEQYLMHQNIGVSPVDERPQVAVVVAEGEILDGEQKAGTIGGESTSAVLREMREDEKVKAVVLRVNSPGGSAYASELIRREIVALKKAGKPVIISMGDYAASGGYWISMNGDQIYADPSTITGSIGIFGMFPSANRALEKIGVHTDGVSTTPMAGSFDPTRPMNPELGKAMQALIEKGYRDFIGKVADGRKKTPEQIDAVGQGRVWSGAQAKERGLVDQLAGLSEAVTEAAKRAKLGKSEEWRLRYAEKPLSPFEQMLTQMASNPSGRAILAKMANKESIFAELLIKTVPAQTLNDLKFMQEMTERKSGQPVKTAAYCFCIL